MSAPIPISMPDELRESIRKAAKETHLSQQDVIRQSIIAGLPLLQARFRTTSKPQRLSVWDALSGGKGELRIEPMHGKVKKVVL